MAVMSINKPWNLELSGQTQAKIFGIVGALTVRRCRRRSSSFVVVRRRSSVVIVRSFANSFVRSFVRSLVNLLLG